MSAGRPSSDEVVLTPSSPAEQQPPVPARDEHGPLLDDAVTEAFLRRWSDVQARFVDDPRAAVDDAGALVAELLQALAERFGLHSDGSGRRWQHGGEPRTEDLRLALQSYRSFFHRLLHT